jgi:pilus assembly protein CpaB
MEKYKPMLLIIAGIVVALITSYITYDWLQKKAVAGNEKLTKTEKVAIAALDIPVGTVLKKDMVKFAPYLSDTLPDGFFADMSKLEGRVVISSLKEKEPIFETSLAPVGIEGGGVAAIINPNKRAMAVKVDKVIGISGFIAPGHKVDVLVTLDDKKSNPITKTVLQNVLVLATGSKIEKDSKNKPVEVDVITLEVTPTEAEKLALASTEGKIQFALRNFRDTEDVYTRGTTKNTLLSSYAMQNEPEVKTEERSVKRVYRPQIESHTVEVIKGTQVNKVTY